MSLVLSPRVRAALLLAVPAILVGIRFTPIVRRMTDTGDFPAHSRFAQEIAETGRLVVPHFAYHFFMIAVHAVTPWDWPTAALIVTMAGLMGTAMILGVWIQEAVPGRFGVQLALAAVLPLALFTLQPVLPFGPMERDQWLIGYFPPNQWHNPTTLLSKPVALVLFGIGMAAAFGPAGTTRRRIGIAAGLVVLSALIKPNFLMALLPAVGLACLINARRADWKLLIIGLALPTAAVLVSQYLMRYVVQQEEMGFTVVWRPLLVIGLYSPTDPVTLATKVVASVLFPIAVTLLFVTDAVRDRRLGLGWLVFLSGAAFAYLFAEAGGQEDSGNFLWSGQLGAFVLFAVAAMSLVSYVFRSRASASTGLTTSILWGRAAVCLLLLAWHVESGIRHLRVSWYD